MIMPKYKRFATRYPGVIYILGETIDGRKPEKIFYVRYRKNGQMIEEKAGRQFQNDMTEARAAKIRAKRIEGDLPTNKEKREAQTQIKWTIDLLWKEYETSKPGLKGMVTDKNRYEKHIKPRLGDKEPESISPFEIDRLRLSLLKDHKPATVKNVLELLRRILNFGAKRHITPKPSFTIEMPHVNNLVTEHLTPEQIKKLLETIDKNPDNPAGPLMKMALFTGMRRGEIFSLKWDEVDFGRGFISIRGPKGGHDQTIPLNEAARQIIQNQSRTDSPYVFPGRKGNKRVDIKKRLNELKKAAALPDDFRPLHGLRHAYASMLASSGKVDLYTIQKLLTHKSPIMTQRYAYLRDETLRKAAELAGNLVTDALKEKPKEEVPKDRTISR
jgi:integrase